MFAKMFESLVTGDAVLFYDFDLEKNIQKETKKMFVSFLLIFVLAVWFFPYTVFFLELFDTL